MLIETRRCGRLFVEDRDPAAPGTPIVLWPSLLCDGSMWQAQIEALAGRARVVVIDPPGHGKSAPTRAAYTMDDSVDAAIAVLDALQIERCRWAGLSWGGMVGMRLCMRAPERVERLALIDTNADAETKEKLPKYRVMTLVARLFGPIPALLDRVVPIYFSPSTIESRPELVAAFRSRIGAMDRTALLHALDAVMFSRTDVRPRLGSIRCPTLVVVGEDDVATPLPRAEDIVRGISGAELRRIPRAGHLAAWEQPGAVNAHLLPFLLG